MSGRMVPSDEKLAVAGEYWDRPIDGFEAVDLEAHYGRCEARGIEFGPGFKVMQEAWASEWEAYGLIETYEAIGESQAHPAVLDGCLQVFGTIGAATDENVTFLPIALGELTLLAPLPSRVWSVAKVRPMSIDDETMWVDLKIYGEDKHLLATLNGLQLKRTSVDAVKDTVKRSSGRPDAEIWRNWLYAQEWEAVPLAEADEHLPFVELDQLKVVLDRAAEEGRTAELAAYESGINRLELLSVAIILQGLADLGWEWPNRAGVTISVDELQSQLGIVARYGRLMNRLLSILEEVGMLVPVEAGDLETNRWKIVRKPTWNKPNWDAEWTWSERDGVSAELTMLLRCGARLPAILRGEADPLTLLFPQHSGAGEVTAENLYGDTPGARYVNGLVSEAVAELVKSIPAEQTLRVLEIGAGTGGTTTAVLPHLPENCVYTFTDVSPLFGIQAQEKFGEHDFIDYRTLDIERSPAEQGFEEEQFDLIIGANVLHATRDLGVTAGHVAELIAPNGRLVLLEGIAPLRFIDLIFGLTDGWWHFEDTQTRPDYPLISVAGWEAVLANAGFEQVTGISTEDGILAKNGIVLAQAPTPAPTEERVEKRWLVVNDGAGSELSNALASLVRTTGDGCLTVEIGEVDEALADFRPTDVVSLLGVGETGLDGIENLDGSVCEPVLALVQALARWQSEPPKLWLVTQGVHDRLAGLRQAPLWGMGLIIGQEHPEWRCCVVDVGGLADVDQLMKELSQPEEDARDEGVILRNGERFAPRLKRWAGVERSDQRAEIRPDGCYLITGGLRGLGLLTAEWLVAQGARHLVLIGPTL